MKALRAAGWPFMGVAMLATAGCSGQAAPPVAQTVTVTATTTVLDVVTSTILVTPTPEETASEGPAASTPATSDLTPGQATFIKEWKENDSDPSEPPTDEEILSRGADDCALIGDTSDDPPRYLIEEYWGRLPELARTAQLLCPGNSKHVSTALTGFGEGNLAVGSKTDFANDIVKAGKYRTAKPMSDCYWERTTGGGATIANDFVTNAPSGVTVTIRATDGGFSSRGCGAFLPVK